MSKILIVDDDPDICEAVELTLKHAGYDVSSAGNRDEGMDAIKAFDPDLLILDVMMEQPDDGIAMAQELRRSGFNKPILMMTSLAKVTGMSYDKDDELVPVDAFVEKPTEPAKLAAMVKELLEKGRA